MAGSPAAGLAAEPRLVLRYAHPNEPESLAGRQAEYFASEVAARTKGAIAVEVYPSSRLGTLEEQVRLAAEGRVAFTHQTAATIGSLHGDLAVLDLPYAYRDVAHLLRVTDPSSPLMRKLGEGLVRTRGLRILSSFYFGTRQLTCDRPVRRPEDLAGLLVRAIPFPVYEAAVEGLGARPVPLEWSRTPTALAAGSVNGQENPVNTILASRLYEHQGYLMLTGHIMASSLLVVNEAVWQGLPKAEREALAAAARAAGERATRECLASEASDLEALKAKGMKVIGPAEGLDREAFAARARELVRERFGERWKTYITMIEAER
ncbi:MAG TPA: TRAP transporter substrate-binding protein [Spirochaetales bacterium]|nr:TRAP transporter substrate-binding protein [Spirochaetales bacterium]HRZ65019.1 TRAP transporter substrate-binding protein [Spirochaetia bacterium]